MSYKKLKQLQPIIHAAEPEYGGRIDTTIKTKTVNLPVKWEVNTRNEMNLLRRYTHGDLRYENTGRTCENCVNYYPDPSSSLGGRCRAKGFIEVHPDMPADDRPDWTDPTTGLNFKPWPMCPLFLLKERLSRK